MGVVYLARQPALGRFVVLKKIRGDLGSDANILERFQREARAAAGVHHQNVVAVYDCFSIRGDHYIAQEYVDGQDLRTVLSKLERLDPHIAHLIALEIARALEEIHAGGIVHRDLKPANILLGKDGETKIADFGIALEGNGGGLTRPGTVVGSVPYLSPEQMLGERIDCRSDLFQFGILLYEMVAGAPPFEESNGDDCDTLLERMQRGLYASPRKGAGSLPGHLVRLIKGCLRARPAKRIPSATHIRRRLERRLGNISPVDCRQAIADYLWSRGGVRGLRFTLRHAAAGTVPGRGMEATGGKVGGARGDRCARDRVRARGLWLRDRVAGDCRSADGARSSRALDPDGRARADPFARRADLHHRGPTRARTGGCRDAPASRPGQRTRDRPGACAVGRPAVGRCSARGLSLRDHSKRQLHRPASRDASNHLRASEAGAARNDRRSGLG